MAKRKLLIVDDDPHIRKLLRLYLRDTPYDLFEAANAEEVDMLSQKHRFDVVLLDLVLPHHGGFGICQELKAGQGSCPYVIMMTGEDSPETRETAKECGADDFLPKPFEPQEVRDRVVSLASHGLMK